MLLLTLHMMEASPAIGNLRWADGELPVKPFPEITTYSVLTE